MPRADDTTRETDAVEMVRRLLASLPPAAPFLRPGPTAPAPTR